VFRRLPRDKFPDDQVIVGQNFQCVMIAVNEQAYAFMQLTSQ
jgi:hypothetical protein